MLKKRISFNRKSVLLVGVVLSLAVLGFAGLGTFSQFGGQIAGFFSADSNQTSSDVSKLEKADDKLREADDPEGRASWFMYQRMYPFDKVPDDARKRAFDEVIARGEGFGPEGATSTWNPVGPMPTFGAGPGGAVSGRINQIVVSPGNTQIVLIAGSTGGIWRSGNGGATFAPVSDNQVDLAVGSIAFAPSNPNIVYAGMGDKDNSYFGSGVLKSTDAGETWTRVNVVVQPPAAGLPEKGASTSIKVDPTNPNKVYLARNTDFSANCNARSDCGGIGGIYVSTDGGANWMLTKTGLATDLAIHPTQPQTVYAALTYGNADNEPRGLFKSTDGGMTWAIAHQSPFTANQRSTADFRVAVTPADPNRVYVYYGDGGSNDRRVEVSTDAGANFTNRGAIGTDADGLDPGQFNYNTYLVADPINANTVWVGSRDFFKSTDGGAKFTNLNNSFRPPYTCDDCFQENLQKVHTDQQSFAFMPGNSNTFYVGNDGGIFKTTDGGATFASLNPTLSLAQFIDVAIHPTNANLSYAGAQDNGSQRRTVGTNNWTEFTQTGDGGKVVISPANNSIVFLGGTNGSISRNTETGTPQTQMDVANAATFGATGNPARIGFFAPITGNGVDVALYSGSWQLYKCTDCNTSQGIGNWTRTSDVDLTMGGDDTLNAIAVAKSNMNDVIYTGSTNGKAMRSSDSGANWTDITTGLPTRSITNITVSKTNTELVYLTVSGYGTGHVFKSINGGTNWTNISNNLPDIPTSAFLIDPQNATTLYAGTDIGVFRSTDDGGSWAIFNTGLPPVPVTSFTAQASGKIQLGSYGRGVYELGAAAQPRLARADYDGDGRTDLSVFRGSEGNWYLNRSTDGFSVVKWGVNNDVIVPADFDGDRKTDVAVWRPSDVDGESDFYVLKSSDSTVSGVAWGTTADMPVVADYDGDGKADYAVWREATGDFYVLQSQTGNLRHYKFGTNGDKPVSGDFDGDGKADFAVFRPSNGIWYIARSADNGVTISPWGVAGDIPVFADYDGDSKADVAVFRPSDGVWYIQKSTGGTSYISFGTNGDIPVPGDYDGDGKSDQAVYRNGVWYLNSSTSGFSVASFGLMSDIPTPRNYLPQ